MKTRFAAVVLLALAAGACHKAPVPAKPEATFATPADAYTAWGQVLSKEVSDAGKIDFAELKKDHRLLDAMVAWDGAHGPKSQPADFPTREAKIAYYLNSYNSLAMYNAITNKSKPRAKVLGPIPFFLWTKMRIDGEWIDLHKYENAIIRPMGEPRVHFALNCMVRGCPRLPQVPYSPDAATLEGQLDAGAKLFFNEDRNVKVNAADEVVRFSSILKFYTEDFLKKSPSLIAYANQYRAPEQQIPPGYKVEFIPYDWTLNQR